MKEDFYIQQAASALQPNPTHRPANYPPPSAFLLGGLIIALPLLCIAGIIGYRKHRVFVLRRQIATLERLWRLDSTRKTP